MATENLASCVSAVTSIMEDTSAGQQTVVQFAAFRSDIESLLELLLSLQDVPRSVDTPQALQNLSETPNHAAWLFMLRTQV